MKHVLLIYPFIMPIIAKLIDKKKKNNNNKETDNSKETNNFKQKQTRNKTKQNQFCCFLFFFVGVEETFEIARTTTR